MGSSIMLLSNFLYSIPINILDTDDWFILNYNNSRALNHKKIGEC